MFYHFKQTTDLNRLSAEAGARILLSSMKPDIKEMYRNATLLVNVFFVLENTVIFQRKNIIYVNV